MIRRLWFRFAEGLDAPLMVIVLLLVVIGFAAVYSASIDSPARFRAQGLNFAVAFAVMWGLAQMPPQRLQYFALPVYADSQGATRAGLADVVSTGVFPATFLVDRDGRVIDDRPNTARDAATALAELPAVSA